MSKAKYCCQGECIKKSILFLASADISFYESVLLIRFRSEGYIFVLDVKAAAIRHTAYATRLNNSADSPWQLASVPGDE